jgi:PEP-CTERM motif
MIRKAVLLTAALCLVLGMGTANAIPILQVYIEGATYDDATDTWVVENDGSFRIWVIGNVEGEGGKGTIEDVMLTAAVSTQEITDGGTIALDGTTVDGDGELNDVTDPSAASDPGAGTLSADGAIPTLGDGSSLPNHGQFGAGTSFYQFSLGDFSLTDSEISDFNGIDAFPDIDDGNFTGQINAYDVTVSGFTTIHFDAFNHVEGQTKAMYIFAPFSHDGEGDGDGGGGGGGGSGPEPGTIALFGMGLAGLAVARRK